ncbi:putative P450 monooxygenase [Lactarius indigo]|nr:putative P450 monooxygenase [Lactarius indigo]
MALFSLPGFPAAIATIVGYSVWRIIYNLYFHSLSHFPGPKLAACSRLWLAYRELIRGQSLGDLRAELHRQYGEVVRLAPNELHFSNPAAHSDIYNHRNKWDKDYLLYRAFDLDTSTIGFIRYSNAKQRREVLAPLFSRTSILQMQDLVRGPLHWTGVVGSNFWFLRYKGKSSDLVLGFQCFAVDVIMSFCYAKNWDATKAPDFESDIVLASHAVLPLFTMGKYLGNFVRIMGYIPKWFGINFGPSATRAVFLLRGVLTDQIDEIVRNPGSLENASHRIIYHSLLDPDANKGRPLPSKLSLWHEAGALLAAGSDTTAVSATTISYHVLHNPEVQQRLIKELHTAWPVLEEVPRYEVFEKLPYLASPYAMMVGSVRVLSSLLQTAVVKEGLRMFPGGAALPRVVPPDGAMIAGTFIPGGTVVGQCFLCVHRSPVVFSDPDAFIPDRWLGEDAKTHEASLAVFSKGPRSCIGINLAYCELYTLIAGVFRRFDVTLDAKRPGDLTVMEHFAPVFKGQHLRAYCKPVSD